MKWPWLKWPTQLLIQGLKEIIYVKLKNVSVVEAQVVGNNKIKGRDYIGPSFSNFSFERLLTTGIERIFLKDIINEFGIQQELLTNGGPFS